MLTCNCSESKGANKKDLLMACLMRATASSDLGTTFFTYFSSTTPHSALQTQPQPPPLATALIDTSRTCVCFFAWHVQERQEQAGRVPHPPAGEIECEATQKRTGKPHPQGGREEDTKGTPTHTAQNGTEVNTRCLKMAEGSLERMTTTRVLTSIGFGSSDGCACSSCCCFSLSSLSSSS